MSSEAASWPDVAALTTGTWRVMPEASTARFTVRDKTFFTVHGTLPVVDGTATLALGGVVSHARVQLDATAIETGNVRREKHLASPGLLNSSAHPFVLVIAESVAPGPDGWALAATLSARGVSCPVGLHATLAGEDDGGLRVHVTGRLDRTGLAMKVPLAIIGRHVDLDVDLLFAAAQ